MECPQCGLQFLDPIPDKKALDKIYADYYKAWDIKQSGKEVSMMKTRTFQRYLGQITNFVSSGTLLDIGCATGELLAVAREMGFDVYGVEVSPEGIRRCKERFGEDRIIGKNLKPGDFPPEFFDVITLSDILEHMPDPSPFLDNIYNILKPNGILMIVTPDTSSWTRKVLGTRWLHYKEEHVYYYNSNNIFRLLSPRFHIFSLGSAYKSLTLDYCASIIKNYATSGAVKKITSVLKHLPASIGQYPLKINIGEMLVLSRKRNK